MGTGHPSTRQVLAVALTAIFVVLLPVVYVGILNSALRRQSFQFNEGWRESRFLEGWRFVANVPTNGSLEVDGNATLTIRAPYPLGPGSELTAQRTSLPSIDFGTYRYLVVSVRVPSFFVAARVVLWISAETAILVLLKTYADNEWHREVVDLHLFGIGSRSPLYLLELSVLVVERPTSTETVAMYRDLFFGKIEGGVG